MTGFRLWTEGEAPALEVRGGDPPVLATGPEGERPVGPDEIPMALWGLLGLSPRPVPEVAPVRLAPGAMAELIGRRQAHGHGLPAEQAEAMQALLDAGMRHLSLRSVRPLPGGGERRRNLELLEGLPGIFRVRRLPGGDVELAPTSTTALLREMIAFVNEAATGDAGRDRGYRIRPATPADAEAIGGVLLAAGLDAWAAFLGAERIQAANRGVRHPADLVAADDEGVFAFVAWDEATGEIERLYTHPRGQRRGAAAELLARALDALRAAGRTEAWLNTEERNVGARMFYERQGWVEDGPPRVRDWHGARLVEPRYVKRLR